MRFEDRRAKAENALIEFLNTKYVPPRGLSAVQQANIIGSIADAFARKMPVKGDFDEAMQRVFTQVSDTHERVTWPPQPAFVLAMPQGDKMGRPAPESFRPADDVEHYSALMSNDDPVPANVLWAQFSSRLPRQNLERYRSACVMAYVEIYGHRAQRIMEQQFGQAVSEYFTGEGAA